MSLSCGAVDHMDIPIARLHQGVKQTPPYAASGPAMEAVVDRCWRPVAGGAILPPASRTQNMNDATDNPAVIRAMRAGLVRRQMRFNRRPGVVAQPEKRVHHRLRHIFACRESDLPSLRNSLIGF